MGSKRNSSAASSMEFSRTNNSGKEDKCKEFWKYLDDKKTLQPYQPPKLSRDCKQSTSSINSRRSVCGASVKEPLFPSKGAKPKQPIKKQAKPKNYCCDNKYYEKMFRENVKLATCDQSFESLLAEIDDYEKRLEIKNTCPVCKHVECICKEKAPK